MSGCIYCGRGNRRLCPTHEQMELDAGIVGGTGSGDQEDDDSDE